MSDSVIRISNAKSQTLRLQSALSYISDSFFFLFLALRDVCEHVLFKPSDCKEEICLGGGALK